jgi:hypothetical protein
MFDGLSRRELIGWAVCLVLAAAASVTLTRPEEYLPPRRRHAHALFRSAMGPFSATHNAQ